MSKNNFVQWNGAAYSCSRNGLPSLPSSRKKMRMTSPSRSGFICREPILRIFKSTTFIFWI